MGSKITPNNSGHPSETSDNDYKQHFYDARKSESCQQNLHPAFMNNSMELPSYIMQIEEGGEQHFNNTHDSSSNQFEMTGDIDLTKVFDH